MLNLNDRKWKAFYLIGQQMFYIDAVKTYSNTSELNLNGIYDVVGATSKNNGNVGFLTTKYDNLLCRRNCICLIKTGQGSVGNAVYKANDFIPSNNVCVIRSEWLNRYNGLFIVAEINKQANRYSYGYIRNTKRIQREKLLLPITADGAPDYAFMEQYIKEREQQLIQKYKDYIGRNTQKLGLTLENREWKAFTLSDIFTISSGKRLTTADMDKGNLAFIGATEMNNGITNWVHTSNETLDRNVLGVNYNGSVAESFYHSYNCIFSDDVKRLHLKNHKDGKYVLLFCALMIKRQKSKYTYGYKFNANRMTKQKILLPTTPEGNPDYAFMENYAKMLMLQKYQQYLTYKNA